MAGGPLTVPGVPPDESPALTAEPPQPTLLRKTDDSSDPSRAAVRSTLPPEVLAKVGRRLGLMALLYAVSYLVMHMAARVASPLASWREGAAGMRSNDAVAALFIAASLGVFAIARSGALHPVSLVRAGLVYEVIAALGIELGMLYFPPVEALVTNAISWSCVLIAVFPLIVPSTPGQTLVTALAAASMRPVVFALLAADGATLPDSSQLFLLTLPNFLCVGVAAVATSVVNEFGADLSRARRMGSYQLVERLGVGGMGEVWRATHRLLARPAAIKLIRPESLGTASGPGRVMLQRRFEREARATAALASPHTIQLHDYGVTTDGTFYYVMELLHGVDLGMLVRRFGAQPPARVAHILRQTCRSLAEAHATGLVHRDVKPENIYLCRVGIEYDFVKVLDFGLVKSVRQEGAALTQQNMATGTPAFMAPELALGEPAIDGRVDLYSLGCTAYWLLTEHLVFDGQSPMRTIFAHINDPPARVSGRAKVAVPSDLEGLVMALLAKHPDERPASADDVIRLLDAMDVGEPWTASRAADWWRAHLPEFA